MTENKKGEENSILYVPQCSYAILPLNPSRYTHIFSDGATSCVIAIGIGKARGSPSDERCVTLAHLGAPEQISNYLAYMGSVFEGDVDVHLSGANPPDETASIENAMVIFNTFGDRNDLCPKTFPAPKSGASQAPTTLTVKTFAVSVGDPREEHRDAFGLCLSSGEVVREVPVPVTLEIRDPTSLFFLWTMLVDPSEGSSLPYLFDAQKPMSARDQEVVLHVMSRPPNNTYTLVADRDDHTILNEMSTTPAHEPLWFPESMRRPARRLREYMQAKNIPLPVSDEETAAAT